MKRLFFLILLLFPLLVEGRNRKQSDEVATAVIDSLFLHQPKYARAVVEYDASLYMKARFNTEKSNFLLRYLPYLSKLSGKNKLNMLESITDIHYSSPDIYDTKVRYSCGTLPPMPTDIHTVKRLFSINVYSETLLPNQLISPLSRLGRCHYVYNLVEEDDSSYTINITPKFKSVQLVGCRVVVAKGSYHIRQLEVSGMVDFEQFRIVIEMGSVGAEMLLPVKVTGQIIVRCMKNRVRGEFVANLTYEKIVTGMNPYRHIRFRKHHHDLTSQYSLRLSKVSSTNDFVMMDSLRPLPLTMEEKHIYVSDALRKEKAKLRKDTVSTNKLTKDLLNMGTYLVSYHNLFDTQQAGRLRMPGLLDIESLDYSGSNGLTYKLRAYYTNRTSKDRSLYISPRMAYNFKLRELEGVIKMDYLYLPQLRGMWRATGTLGERISHKTHESTGDDDPDVYDRFKDFGVSVMHSIEPVNGLQIEAGIDFHHRYSKSLEYNSFAPRLIIQWTPGLYYYMKGREKVNLSSSLPTFRIDMEEGISGVWGSKSRYQREEFEVLQTFPFGLKKFMLRFGVGAFSNTRSTFFIDFRNFSSRPLREMYASDIGGRYYLLSHDAYSSSKQYMSLQTIFETPFLFFHNSSRRISLLRRERIYLSALKLQKQKYYIEYGYGFSTHLFDVAVFSKVLNGKFSDFGFRIGMEVFRDRNK